MTTRDRQTKSNQTTSEEEEEDVDRQATDVVAFFLHVHAHL